MGDINETISVNAGPGIAGLKEFTDALDQASAKWAAFEDKLNGGGGGAGPAKLAASMDAAAASISEAAAKINAAVDKVGASADTAAGGIERLGSAAGTAGGGLDEAAAGADAAAAASDRLAEAADAAGASLDVQAASAARAGKSGAEAAASSEGFGKVAKVALLGLGVAAAYGLDKAMKFQSQMLLLNTQAGVSLPKVKQMSQGVLEISTQTGQSLSDVSESAYHVASNMASMGSTVPNMLKATKIAAEGASVGHAHMVDVTNALTASIASGIPGVKNYSQAMGMLNATVGSGDMNMQDLSEAFGTGMVASVKGYGLSLKDVGAGLAVFGDNNIRGAKAGTDMRMAVQSLAVPAASAKKELAGLGLTQNSLAKDMQSGGLLKALDDLNGKFKEHGITAKNEGQVITDLFGKKAGVGLSLLMEQMDRLKSKYPAITAGANSFNAAWEKTQQSPAQKWKEAVAGLQASATGFGTQLLPAFSSALGFADKILADINGTKGAAQGLAVAFGGAAALFTGKKLVSGVESAFKTGETVLRGVGKISEVLKIPGLDKLSNIGKSAGLDTAAESLTGAAGDLSAAAAKLSEGGLGGAAGAAGKAEGGAAATAEGAGAGGLLAKIGSRTGMDAGGLASAANPIAAGVAAGLLLRGYSDSLAPKGTGAGDISKAIQKGNPISPDWALGGIIGKLGTSNFGLDAGKFLSRGLSQASQMVTDPFDAARHGIAGLFGGGGPAQMQRTGGGRGDAVNFAAVKPPDTGAFTSAGHAIESAFDGAKARAGSALSGIASEVGSAGSKAASEASSAFHGVESAVASGMSSAAAAAGSGAGRIESALARLPGELTSVGSAAMAGLAHGIESGIGAVIGAAEHAAGAVEGAMKNVLKIFSPSKVTEKIGKSAVDGLVVGLEGGQAAVTAAAQALGQQTAKAADVTAIDTAITKGIADAGKDSALVKYLKADQSKLLALAAQRTKLEAEITDAQQIAQAAISGASIMNASAATPYDPSTVQSPYTLVQGQQMQAQQAAMFAKAVGQDKKLGLNATSLNQIVQSGASAGLPVAQGIAQGGKSTVAQLNALQAQIHASAAKLGDEGAGPMYQAGVQAGQGLAEGIKASLGSVDAAISQMAKSMVATIEKDLKIHSPSLVFAERGAMVPAGVAMGVDAGAGQAAAAVGRMGSRMTGAYHPAMAYAGGFGGGHGGGSGSGSGSGGGDTHVTVNMTVMGSVSTQNDLINAVQRGLLKKGSNNWQVGVIRPGRGG